jgi:septum formation protein
MTARSPLAARIVLASASPRRQELLRQIGLAYTVVVPDVHEERGAGESPADYVRRVATDKAHAGRRLACTGDDADLPVLAADTEVICDGQVLGKPRDREDGAVLLRRLAAREHQVLTAICLLHDGREHHAHSSSRVRFGPLTEQDILRYWNSGESKDKAGGYGIQGRAAGFIAHLDGSYSGVMGLPLYELVQLLKSIGIEWP